MHIYALGIGHISLSKWQQMLACCDMVHLPSLRICIACCKWQQVHLTGVDRFSVHQICIVRPNVDIFHNLDDDVP